MNNGSLVSVICLCHNHADFVEEAIQSVMNQNHENVELIVVNDGSTDQSKERILSLMSTYSFHFIDLDRSIGNCKAFNIGFRKSTGDYIIDLAADDLLLSDRITYGLATFKAKDIGVEYCNVENISIDGTSISTHFNHDDDPPEGDIYVDLIAKYIISPPGMMIKREVMEHLNGYDELLSYEDFDFWIRSSRLYPYGYTDKVLVRKRLLKHSLSKRQFTFRNRHQRSTLRVCQKIKTLNHSPSEAEALTKRCWYEIKQCIRYGNLELIPHYLKLL